METTKTKGWRQKRGTTTIISSAENPELWTQAVSRRTPLHLNRSKRNMAKVNSKSVLESIKDSSSEPPPLGEHVRRWDKYRFWLEPNESNQKKLLGSTVENAMRTWRFRLVARANVGQSEPASVLDYVYALVVPREFMTDLLFIFKSPRVLTYFRNKCSALATADGTRFLNIGDPSTFPPVSCELLFLNHVDKFRKQMEIELNQVTQTKTNYRLEISILETGGGQHQTPHLDEKDIDKVPWADRSFIIHIPLGGEGQVLRMWDHKMTEGDRYGIPFGSALVLPSEIVHAGCYCTAAGNLRLVMKMRPVHVISEGKSLDLKDFSQRDIAYNNSTHPSLTLSQTREEFPGYQKFTNTYVSLMKNNNPSGTFPEVWLSNILPDLAQSRKRSREDEEET
jgi:hypothetical protein